MAELSWSLQFKRMFAGNLDPDYSFKLKTDLDNYLTSPLKYAGMITYCEETNALYYLPKTMTKWEEIKGSGSGIEIVNDYSKLPIVSDYTICYSLNDYINTSVTPNETYKSGFYLYDKSNWNNLNVSISPATNTSLGGVIIKQDGGIGVDAAGNIWVEGYSKNETTDPGTGEITTITTIGGVTTTVVSNPTTGESTTTTEMGGIKVESTDDGKGNVSEKTNLGGAELKEETNADGTKYTTIGGKVVEGSKTETTTNTTTDPSSGNTITETITTITTPNGSEQTKETVENDVATGNTITIIENIKGGSDGVDVGSASGDRTTTTTDSTGNTIDTTTEDVSYTNGEEDQWLTQDEADKIIDNIGGNLGWD